MGLAIIVPSISFEDANLGKVTLSGNEPIRGLYINLEGLYTGTEVDLKCSYLPANTTQRNVVWSIESGSEYASISGNTLTILQGAQNNEVTIKCISVSNPSVVAEKTITVTHEDGIYRYEWIASPGATTPPSGMTYDSIQYTETGVFHATNANLDLNKFLSNYTLEVRLAPVANTSTTPQVMLCTSQGYGVKFYLQTGRQIYVNVNGTAQQIGNFTQGATFKIEHKNSKFTIYKDGVQIAQGDGFSSEYLPYTGLRTEPGTPSDTTTCGYIKYYPSV